MLILCHIPCLMAGHLKEVLYVLYSLAPVITSKPISQAAAWVPIGLITLIRRSWTFIPNHGMMMMMPLAAVDAIRLGTFRPGQIIPRCQVLHLPTSVFLVVTFFVYLSAFTVLYFLLLAISWPFIITTLSTLGKVFVICIFSLKLKNRWLFDC